jgi:CRP/FNR family transcriptional regulator, cyclic AMP receptor protein
VAHIYPVLVLHLILLPVNTWRLVQMLRLAQEVGDTGPVNLPIKSLLAFMTSRPLEAGQVLIKKGR